MAEGFIFLHRQLSTHDLWLCEKFTRGQAWVDLLMLANHKPGVIRVRGLRIDVLRGQVGYSEVSLSARWRWSRDKVRRFMHELENDKMIAVARDNKTSVITILNYDQYQILSESNDTADKTASNTADRQQTDTNKNEKNEKKKTLESPDGDSSGSAHAAPSVRPQKRPPCPYSEILALYHEMLPQLPTVQSFDDSAKKTMRARWNEAHERQDLKFWRRVFVTVAASDFLMGRVKDWQCPGLLWIIGPKNFAKIVNGHYSNHGPRTGSSLTDSNLRIAQEWAAEGGTPQ